VNLKIPVLPKLPKLPKAPHLPRPNFEPGKKALVFLLRHKISVGIITFIIVFVVGALWYRGYLLSKMSSGSQSPAGEFFYSAPLNNLFPATATPTPDTTNSSDNSNNSVNEYAPVVIPTPFPTLPPIPTIAPIVIPTTTSSSSTGNPNCTTGSGTANSWYSDVYPNPPVTTNTGSVTMQVTIRDCNVNTAPVNDNLTISLVSGDSNTQVNGNNLPYSITASNGTANFTVTSQITGTVTLSVHDDTNNFTVTNINNQNPSISFTASSGSSSCSTANGTPNSWYSDYYPSSGISANTGATVTITVHIRDCSQADVSSDNVTMTQTSSDSSLTINGSSSPVSVQAQNGIATFNLVSQNAGTDTFTVQDTTSNFAVTDINNQSLSITFSGSSTTPTPTPTPGLTNTPTPIATPS
jgi:hypothetical protein